MTLRDSVLKSKLDASSHPVWCKGPDAGCSGRHESVELEVPGEELSGIGVSLYLWGGRGRDFVRFGLNPVIDNPVSFAIACEIAVAIVEGQRDSQDGSSHELYREPVYQDPTDPIYVTDPHGHDLTVGQAEILHAALGELLARVGG